MLPDAIALCSGCWGLEMSTPRHLPACPDRARHRKAAEESAHATVGGAAPQFIAWLDELKPAAQAGLRASWIKWTDSRGDPATWRLLLDCSAKQIAFRDGEPER